MKVTMKEAEALVPVSRTTLYNDKKAGTFSIEKNAKGRTVIDTSELQRVYGELNLTSEQSNNVQSDSKSTKSDSKKTTNENSKDVSVELEVLKERIKHLEEIKLERQKDKEQFEERIEKMQATLDKALENQNKTTLLLEHYTKEDGKGDDWKIKLEKMEKRIANQEQTEAEALAKQKELEKELEIEKNKSFIHRMLGK